ncbi:MAG: DEAD/DEAH box helicase [Myxococcales bacterium]|nr:DEAD/DEAH box helicase [Myxococcales bacterium]
MPFSVAHPTLRAALTERGYETATPVQAAVLAAEPAGSDLLVSAQTGSGKTVAYGLALAPTLLGEAQRFIAAKAPLALIVAPTRELALQIQRELGWLYRGAGARIASCVGGMDIRAEQRALANGAHIVVGTPGRLCDHLDRGNLVLTGLLAVVLDEADEMLDLGFREDLERILDTTPATRRTLLFSATIPRPIATLARRFQRDAVRIATSPEGEQHVDIEYRAITMAPQDREKAVVNVLRYFEARGALIFCATRDAVNRLQSNLLERGFSVVALSGELSQNERVRALQALRDGRARVCVATDVAARGLDLPDLGLVIHAELPKDRQILLHRSGRTGRAGKKGMCVMLVSYPARRNAERLFAAAKLEAIWSSPPSANEVHERDQERLIRDLSAVAEECSEEDRLVARALLELQSAEDLAAALVRFRRAELPAPEELTEAFPVRPSPQASAPRHASTQNAGSQHAGSQYAGSQQSAPSGRRQLVGSQQSAPSAEPQNVEPQQAATYEWPQRASAPSAEPPYVGSPYVAPPYVGPQHDSTPYTGAQYSAPQYSAPQGTTPTPRLGPGDTVLFHMNVGRRGNAEARWILPLLCRRGHIGKEDIGKIRVFDDETRFEIAATVAERFAKAAARPDPQDRSILIAPIGQPQTSYGVPVPRASRPRVVEAPVGSATRAPKPSLPAPRASRPRVVDAPVGSGRRAPKPSVPAPRASRPKKP